MSVSKIRMIYQIYYINDKNINYIGSSMNNNIKKRWSYHVGDFKKYLKDSNNNRANIYPLFKEYSIENFNIIKLKDVNVIDNKHLKAYEQLFINKYKPVNKLNPFNILADVDKKIYAAKYREENKERIKEYSKNRYLNNREQFANYAKENKERIKEYKRQLYLKQKNKLSEKKYCEYCKIYTREDSFKRHTSSKNHIKLSNNCIYYFMILYMQLLDNSFYSYFFFDLKLNYIIL